MASSGTGCDPVVIESDENNSSQNELDSENNFKCCHGKKTYKAEDVLKLIIFLPNLIYEEFYM